MIRFHRHLLFSALTFLVVAACGNKDGFETPPDPTLGPLACAQKCAADGRSVIDCHEQVVATCDAFASCIDGACVKGCDAAVKEQSSVGCEYFASKPSAYYFGAWGGSPSRNDASCYAVMVANTWNAPVELQVEYDGRTLPSSYFRIPRGRGSEIRYELLPEGKLPRDEIAILFLAMEPTEPIYPEMSLYTPCPASVGAAVLESAAVPGNGFGKMFHIRSSAPVVAFDMYPYGGAKSYFPSSSLLLPTSAWATQHLAMDGYSVDNLAAEAGGATYFQVLASENDTHVKIKPTTLLPQAGQHPPVKAGEIGEFLLQRGEFVQFSQVNEANGTGVESDKPTSIVGGSNCAKIPEYVAACDTVHQHLPPIRAFGHEYAANRFRDRGEPEQTPWRILAAADGTQLTYDPPVPGAPTTLNRGEWKEFSTYDPFVVKSQDKDHPIYVVAYMTGSANVSSEIGDPEMVNVVPVGQYLSSYVFLTDPTYRHTNLVFVRDAQGGKSEDVELDCLGTVQDWKKIGNSSYEIAYVDLVKNGVPQGACDNGAHRAWSKSPFGLTVWGYDEAASYGYPAGMGTRSLNELPAIR